MVFFSFRRAKQCGTMRMNEKNMPTVKKMESLIVFPECFFYYLDLKKKENTYILPLAVI